MECRLALVVRNLDELTRGLTQYLAGGGKPMAVTERGRPIPIFTGNLDEKHSDVEILLTGSSGEGLLRGLLAENDLEKFALYWAKGGEIPWAALHRDGPSRLIALPTYPFARQRYWVQAGAPHKPGAENGSPAGDARASGITAEEGATRYGSDPEASGDGRFDVKPEHGVLDNIQRYLVWFLCQETGLTPNQVNLDKTFRSYGVDSIIGARLLRGIEKVFQVRVTGREMLEHATLRSLSEHAAGKVEAMHAHIRTTHPDPDHSPESRAEYRDERVIEALDQLERGTLSLDAVQRLIDG